jgi:hypothetical protein
MSTNQHVYFKSHRRLYITLFDEFVIQSQSLLNLRCSVLNQFSMNNWISSEERKQHRKRMLCKVYVHQTAIRSFVFLITRLIRR